MLLERSNELQSYIEDCEVCCHPIEIEYLFQDEIKDAMMDSKYTGMRQADLQYALNVVNTLVTSSHQSQLWAGATLISGIYVNRCSHFTSPC